MYKRLLSKILRWIIQTFNVTDREKFFKIVFSIISAIGAITCLLIIFMFAYFLDQIMATTIFFIWIKFITRGHYREWIKCTIATTIVAVFFMIFRVYFSPGIIADIVMGIIIGLLFRKC